MSFPNKQTLDQTLLLFISFCGGCTNKQIVSTLLATHFNLTNADLSEKTNDGRQKKWANDCDWSRERLAADGYVYRPGQLWDGLKIVRGSWVLTPQGENAAERIKSQFGEAVLSELAKLAAPIKKENDDPFPDLF